MKITNVRTAQPIAPDSPADWRTSLGQIAVAVETSEGITGFGVGGGGAAGRHVIESVLRDVVVGREFSPSMHGELYTEMDHATLPFGQKGIAIMAISGIDLAIWDSRAKAERLSVAELLGATPESMITPIPTYRTVWGEVDDDAAAGSEPIKLHVHGETGDVVEEEVVNAIRIARERIGPQRELMIDAWMKWGVDSTLRIAEKIATYDVSFIEEPLPAGDYRGYEQLAEECPIPIAGGEHEFGISGFSELIDRKLHHVLQPDACWCGGLTVLMRLYELATQAGLRVIPHRGAEVWGLHAIAALDPNPLAESGRPWMSWVEGQPPIESGQIQLPDGFGFGVSIDERWFGTSAVN